MLPIYILFYYDFSGLVQFTRINLVMKSSKTMVIRCPFPEKEPVSNFEKEKQEFKKLKREQEKDERLPNKERKKKKNIRSARVIVRNLPFKSNENSIRDHFSKFGEVTEINLLRKGQNLVGCCFVQFVKKSNAAKAIAKLSGKQFMGRPIIVDWALPKDKFAKTIKNELESGQPEVKVKKESDFEDINIKSDSSVDDANAHSDSCDGAESDDSSYVKSELGKKSGSDSEVEDEEETESEDSDEEEFEEKPHKNVESTKTNKKYNFQYDPQDVSDGRTIFIKNVPFTASDEELLSCAKEAGSVVYAVICYDRLTEHSKGTGFVKFEDSIVVQDLLQGKKNLVLRGTKLDVLMALKKNQILDKKENKGPKDRRNLYLLREGVILAGSPAAEGVSEGDMAKRLQLENWKTQTLKNLNKFVSSNRLAVHNIPPFIDDDKLRQIFKDNAPKGSVITEARVMRNLRDIDEHGVGKSKGFGFVCFTKHEHALEALRKLNNNPFIFKDTKRPIVGFSIENRVALLAKEKRKVRSQNPSGRPAYHNESKSESSSNMTKGKRKHDKLDDGKLPKFCGYTAKPGAKKLRTRKELNVQAALHHKAIIDKKREKKRASRFGKFKSRKNAKKV